MKIRGQRVGGDAKLGRAWKDLSKKSDAELGIDPNTRVQE